MRVLNLRVIFLTLVFLIAVSCNQDPIFYTIATEVKPQKPKIPGSPTKMVVFKPDGVTSHLYVASGVGLYRYREGRWHLNNIFGGMVMDLAVTTDGGSGEYLYVLWSIGNNTDTILYQTDDGSSWNRVRLGSSAVGYPRIQSIHADPESTRLFAGAHMNNIDNYAILYVDNPAAPVLHLLKGNTNMLTGAVSREDSGDDYHYLSTNGGGAFRVADDSLTAGGAVAESDVSLFPDSSGKKFFGMIKLTDVDNTILAIERNALGAFYEMKDDVTFERASIFVGRYPSGALALWGDPSDPSKKLLLIAGIQSGVGSSSYTYGYVEFNLGSDELPEGTRNDSESGTLKSVSSNDRYKATIGKHPINHLFQAPDTVDSKMTFFASTQDNGLWSYRNRLNGGWQWNAE